LLRSRSQHALTAPGAATTNGGPALTAGSAPRREADPRAGGSRPAGLLLLVLLLLGATTSIAALLPAPALLLLRQLKMLLLRLLLLRRCSRRGWTAGRPAAFGGGDQRCGGQHLRLIGHAQLLEGELIKGFIKGDVLGAGDDVLGVAEFGVNTPQQIQHQGGLGDGMTNFTQGVGS